MEIQALPTDNEEMEGKFHLGSGFLSLGMEISLRSMKVGEVSEFRMNAALAYVQGTMPAGLDDSTVIIFTINMINFEAWDTVAFGLYKRSLEVGEGQGPQPQLGQEETLTIDVDGRVLDCMLEDGSLLAWQEALVASMKEGEAVRAKYQDLSNSALQETTQTVKLMKIQGGKSPSELDADESFKYGEKWKVSGNNLFKQGAYARAVRAYARVRSWTWHDNNAGADRVATSEMNVLWVTAASNASQCLLNINEFVEAEKWAKEALEVDPVHVKSLYRVAKALLGQKRYSDVEAAVVVLNEVSGDPTDGQRLLATMEAARKETSKQESKEQKMYRKMVQSPTAGDGEEGASFPWLPAAAGAACVSVGLIALVWWMRRRS